MFLIQHQFLVVLESKLLLSYAHVPPIATYTNMINMANTEIKLHHDLATNITTKPQPPYKAGLS